MKSIYEKINLWLIMTLIISTMIYLISSLMHGGFDIGDWNVVGRFFTGFIMAVAICATGEIISKLDLEE